VNRSDSWFNPQQGNGDVFVIKSHLENGSVANGYQEGGQFDDFGTGLSGFSSNTIVFGGYTFLLF